MCARGFAEALHCAAETFLVSISAAQLETASTVDIVLTEVQCKIACSKVHGRDRGWGVGGGLWCELPFIPVQWLGEKGD